MYIVATQVVSIWDWTTESDEPVCKTTLDPMYGQQVSSCTKEINNMCIYTYVCIYVHMYICMYICAYIQTYVCMYVCMYVCIRMYVYTFVCMYVC